MAAVKMLAPSGQIEDVEAVSATTVKNSFGDVLEKTLARGVLAITRHDKARVIMLSVQEYEALVRRAGDPLERLHGQFDEMLARMQGPGMDKAVKSLFGSAATRSKAPRRRAARR
jgi:PHD/YefM family antitoxin component YafN of YafNO toxin-antitoxin module